MTESRETQKIDTKAALLKAAEKLFVERGYDSVSTRDLAEEAGVNLGAIQYHFGSKARLFVETVRYLMSSCGCSSTRSVIEAEIATQEEALKKFDEFLRNFLTRLLRPSGPVICRLMFREVLRDSTRDHEMFDTLVSTIAEEFTKPSDEALIKILSKIAPELDRNELEFVAQSVIGQCTFYVSHRPFAEYLRKRSFSESPHFEEIHRHIFIFTMRALKVSEELIKEFYG